MGKGEGAKNKTSRQATTGTADVKIGMAKMLKGGVIMDVIDAEQARIVRYRCRTLANLCAAFYPLPELLGTTARRRRPRAESERRDAAPRWRAVDERSPSSIRAVPQRNPSRATPQTRDHTRPRADR